MAKINFNRTQDDIDLDNWIEEREAGNIRKCEACHTEKFLSEQRQCPDTGNWYCIQCIKDGTMEKSVSNWFNGTITEFQTLIANIRTGRTQFLGRITYVK
jgi:hypothetical protein